MAETKSTQSIGADAQLKVEEFYGTRRYTGSKSALIAAGLAADGDFPGDDGSRKRIHVFELKPGAAYQISRLKGNQFCLAYNFSDQDFAEYEERRKRQRLAQAMSELTDRANARLLTEAGRIETKAIKLQNLQASSYLMWNFSNDPNLPFFFDADVLERAGQLVGELVELYENAEMHVRTDAIAGRDTGFQRFMTKALPTS